MSNLDIVKRARSHFTFDTMFLHGSYLLQTETESVDHEDTFPDVDLIHLIEFQGEYEQGE